MSSQAYEPIANHALSVFPDLNAPGFESSKVFAVTALYLTKPPPGFPSRGYLVKNLASTYLFVIHPTPSRNASKSGMVTKPTPEVFYIRITKNKVEVGRGQQQVQGSAPLFGRKTRKLAVMECSDRDFVNIATGKSRVQDLIDAGKIRFKGNLDYLEKISRILHHHRSELYRVVTSEPRKRPDDGVTVDEESLAQSHGTVPRAHL